MITEAGAQAEAAEIQPADFVRGAAFAVFDLFEEDVRQTARHIHRPGVAAQSQCGFEPRGKFFGRYGARREGRPHQFAGRFHRFAAHHRRRTRAALPTVRGRFAKLELQTPAVVADFGIAPGFERAGFGQPRAQFHRHQPLAALAETNHRFERRVLVEFFVFGELHHFAGLIVGAGKRTDQAERDRLVGDELQIFAIHLDAVAFFGAARHKAHGGSRRRGRRSRRAANRREPARPRRSSERTSNKPRRWRPPDRDRDFRKSPGRLPYQFSSTSATRVAADFRNEEAAVEENRVGHLARRFQKRREMAADRGVRHVGQAEFAEQAALFFFRLFAARRDGQKAFERRVRAPRRA